MLWMIWTSVLLYDGRHTTVISVASLSACRWPFGFATSRHPDIIVLRIAKTTGVWMIVMIPIAVSILP